MKRRFLTEKNDCGLLDTGARGYYNVGLTICLSIFRHLKLIELNIGAYRIRADDSRSTYDNRVCKKLCYGPFLLNEPIHEQQSSLETVLEMS